MAGQTAEIRTVANRSGKLLTPASNEKLRWRGLGQGGLASSLPALTGRLLIPRHSTSTLSSHAHTKSLYEQKPHLGRKIDRVLENGTRCA
ncbi:hypothetical protein RB213_008163 [Colletotrichum asianum]